MDFRTVIQRQKGPFSIHQNQKILCMGSCFAEEMGRRLQEDKFPCDVNPFGVLYNPHSICQALEMLLENKKFTKSELFQRGGLWHSWMHHSSFSHEDAEECLYRIHARMAEAHTTLLTAHTLIVTLGSNRCFVLREKGIVVGNCHKVPEREFEIQDMDAEKIVQLFSAILPRIKRENPDIRVVFTVSPIRYLKYGLHESMLGKAQILVAVEMLQQAFADYVFYFPAFEIMLDDLRDYRFYAEDMVHPSALAAEYIYQYFKDCYFDEDSKAFSKEWKEIQKNLNHRPFNSNSETYRSFMENTLKKIEQLHQKYPHVSVEKELELCTTILNRFRQS